MSAEDRDGENESPLRFMVFNERPDCLVVYLARGTSLRLPEIPYPFGKETLATALSRAGIDYRISTGTPGQWIKTYKDLHLAECAERRQRDAEAVSVKNASRRASGILEARDRAEAIDRKTVIDQEIRVLKAELVQAKSIAYTTGHYMPVSQYHAKEQRLVDLKEQSQALQVRIGELREAEKQAGAERHRGYSERFMRVAHEVLSEDVLAQIHLKTETDHVL